MARLTDLRGNARDRLARKLWLLREFGDGVLAPCAHCGKWLPAPGLHADRIDPSGRYVRANLIPSCAHCNMSRGDRSHWHCPGTAPKGQMP